jgi:hypothetical protein
MSTALEYSTRVVQEGGRRCKKSTLNDLVHLTPLRIPLMNPPLLSSICSVLVGSLKMNTTLEYSTRVVQEGDRRCKKSTLNDLAYLTPLRIPLMNPVYVFNFGHPAEA